MPSDDKAKLAHDLKNVLQVIRHAIEILGKRMPADDARVNRLLDMLRQNADQAISLADDLTKT